MSDARFSFPFASNYIFLLNAIIKILGGGGNVFYSSEHVHVEST